MGRRIMEWVERTIGGASDVRDDELIDERDDGWGDGLIDGWSNGRMYRAMDRTMLVITAKEFVKSNII